MVQPTSYQLQELTAEVLQSLALNERASLVHILHTMRAMVHEQKRTNFLLELIAGNAGALPVVMTPGKGAVKVRK